MSGLHAETRTSPGSTISRPRNARSAKLVGGPWPMTPTSYGFPSSVAGAAGRGGEVGEVRAADRGHGAPREHGHGLATVLSRRLDVHAHEGVAEPQAQPQLQSLERHLWREQHCGPVLATDGVQDTGQGQVVNGLVFMDLQGHILLRGERDDAPGQRAGQGRLAGLAQALDGDGQRAGRADPGCGTHRALPPPHAGFAVSTVRCRLLLPRSLPTSRQRSRIWLGRLAPGSGWARDRGKPGCRGADETATGGWPPQRAPSPSSRSPMPERRRSARSMSRSRRWPGTGCRCLPR